MDQETLSLQMVSEKEKNMMTANDEESEEEDGSQEEGSLDIPDIVMDEWGLIIICGHRGHTEWR